MSGVIDYIDQSLEGGKPHHTSKGLQYSYNCPFCNDHKPRMFVNVGKQVYYCHHCQATGTLITFISEYARIPWKEALKIYRDYAGYSIQLPESLEDEIYSRLFAEDLEVEKVPYDLPEEFISMEDATGKKGDEAYRYLRGRGIDVNTMVRQHIGYCPEGKYKDRIIMPDFEGGDLIYWQARTWHKEPKKKHLKKFYRKTLNPSLSEEQVKKGIRAYDKSDVISNIDLIEDAGMAVICEGRFDSYTIGDIGGCIHGKNMSDTQLMKLVKMKDKIDCVAVMLDGDAFKDALILSRRLYKYFDDVLVCRMPNIEDDPNKLGTKKCIEIINNAQPYSPLFEVKARIWGWID